MKITFSGHYCCRCKYISTNYHIAWVGEINEVDQYALSKSLRCLKKKDVKIHWNTLYEKPEGCPLKKGGKK